MITDKNSKEVFGEASTRYKGEEAAVDKILVSYWNLIRSYILLHFSDKIVIFYAIGLYDSYDFLNYSYIYEFATEEEMQKYYEENKRDYDDQVMIRSVKGNIID